MRKVLYTLTILLFPFILLAQPSQDCIHAIPVCQNTYSFANAFSGIGMGPNEIKAANSCLPNGEENGTWFKISVKTSGNLSFVITPNSISDNYNWSLYNVTDKTCADIFNGNLEIACNASASLTNAVGTNGHTGALTGHPYYGFLFSNDAFEMDIPVMQGKTYMLYVSNKTGSPNGFSIDFGPSTAVLFDASTPTFLFIEPVDCGDGSLIVHFNKPILCNSVQATDFVIGGNTVTNVSSLACSGQGLSTSSVFRLDLSAPISTSGSGFVLNLVSAISDVCGNTNASAAINFTAAPVVAKAGNDFTFCKGNNVNIQIGDSSANYANAIFTWTASSPLVQNAISNPNSLTPTIVLNNIPADTVQLILTITSGACTDQDTMYLYFRDCCKNYDAQIANFQNINCYGASTGQATATAVGSISGFNPTSFSYVWSNASNIALTTGLVANTKYSVTVTDQLGCSDTTSITLSQPNSPITATTSGSILACHGANTGSIQLSVSGATPPYSYQWNNNATTEDLYHLTAGTYTVTITDAKNCTVTKSESVTQPPSPILITGIGSTIACGATTGNINISVSGGGAPYVYAWSNGATSQDINGLAPGTYTVTVTDLFGCKIPKNYTVNTLTNLVATTTATNAACSTSPTGTVAVTATGGQSPYTYKWNYNGQTTQSLSNLPAGLYTVTVTDATNCEVVASATVGQLSSLSVSANISPISCSGGTNGGISLTVLSSTPNNAFTYQWSNNASTQNLTNLSAGNYAVTVTDANGCSSSGSFNLNSPTPVSASTSSNDVSCNGGNNGSVSVLANGGAGFYTYQWSNNLGTTSLINNVGAGNYTVTITDANGCTATGSTSVSQPSPISIHLMPTTIACTGNATGSITTLITGGTGSYAYNWSNGIGNVQHPNNLSPGTYHLTVTDGNGCTKTASATIIQLPPMSVGVQNVSNISCHGGNNGSINLNIINGTAPFSFNWTNGIGNTQNPNNLSVGNYSVTVTDANGCTATTSATLTAPIALSASATSLSVSCHGGNNGSITLTRSGGVLPYSYAWSSPSIGNVQNPTNLAAGTYTVTITDGNGCQKTASTLVAQPPILSVSLTNTNITCHGASNASITTNVSGGTSPYTYTWNNPAIGNVQNPANLAAGTYLLTVTDNKGCTATASATVTQPSQMQATLTATNVSCFGGNDGAIAMSVSGGKAPYTFSWNNNAPNIQNPNGLSANVYTCTVTDANNCVFVTNSVAIAQPSALNLMVANLALSTCNNNNGAISVIAGGGVPPYNYQWSPNAGVTGNTTVANNLGNGVYHVSVTDNNGCTDAINSLYFAAHPTFQLSATVTHPYCVADSGQIQILGIPSYTYQWSSNAGGSVSNHAVGLQGGNYSVTVSDGTCDTTLNFVVNSANIMDFTHTTVNENCGQEDGTITINIQSGVPSFRFDWDIQPNPGNVSTVTNLGAGNYQVTVTDGQGCQKADFITLIGTSTLSLNSSVGQPTCSELGNITVTPSQGTSPYTFSWNNAAIGNTPNPTNLNPGSYAVTVTDNNNCEATLNFDLATEGLFQILVDNFGDNSCPNGTEGFISLSTTSTANILNYIWSNQATTKDISNLAGGIYIVTITDPASGCTETGTYEVMEPEDFTVILPEDISISPGEMATLEAIASDVSVIFSWAGEDGFISNNPSIQVSPGQTTIYTLTASLPNCPPKVYQVQVFVTNQGNVLIPDAFSPNNDGLNDDFFIYTKNGVNIVEFQVFNKWGEKMHDNATYGWDGTYRNSLMQNDAYVYVVKLEHPDGTEEMLKGQFLLVR
jgi:gliding motility-associated-like protein